MRATCATIEDIEWHMEQLAALAPGGWVYEDELPEDYPYDAMFPYSIVDVARLFPRLPERQA